jgi:hypothetical protein
MKKNDWIFSGVVGLILLIMTLSNIWLMTLFLGMRILYMFIYVAGIIVILLTMTHYSVHQMGERAFSQTHWIQNHLIFWILTDLHTIIMLARYLLPNERQGGLLPELFFLIHLLWMIPVFFSYKSRFYQKHELGLSFCLHVLIYGLLSYSFIQVVIQTMQ